MELGNLKSLRTLSLSKSVEVPQKAYNIYIRLIRLILFSYVAAINRLFSANNRLSGNIPDIPAKLGDLTNLENLILRKLLELPRTFV